MRKTIGMSLILILIMMMTPSAGAIKLDNTNAYWMTGVHTDGINNDPNDQAEMLKKLGLFLGTEKGFELERSLTRAEAAVMLVRFLGSEAKVLDGTWRHPFTDVPQWADKYVGWLYQSGLTKGIRSTKYGAGQNTTLEQYAVFLSRAVCGNDNWEINGIATADEVKLWDKDNGFFSRAAAVGMSTRALTLTYTRNGNGSYSMAQYLVDHDVFTPEQLLEAAWGVLPPDYCYLDAEAYISNRVAGVIVGKTTVGGLRDMTGTDSALPYFYACATHGQNVILYQVDCKTMESKIISSKALPGDGDAWTYTYAATIDGKDYLLESSPAAKTANLVECDEDRLTTALADFKLSGNGIFPNQDQSYFVTDEALLIGEISQYYLVNKDGISKHTYPVGTHILGFDGASIVTQLVTEKETTISCLRASDGMTTDVYTVAQDMPEDDNRRTVAARGYGRYYGEAGLYVLDSESGRLKQATARPTMDITFFRMDYRYIILTHDLGKQVYGANGKGGDQIVLIEPDGTERVLLGTKPAHGIAIAGFINPGDNGSVVNFYSAADVGMQHFNVYNYALLPSYGKQPPTVVVTGYQAGRPELEPEGYEQSYIHAEQARLNALGYGYKN